MAEPTATIFGIKNCDTMKKARGWLDTRGVAYEFQDYRADGITQTRLVDWAGQVGWEKLLNRAGTTFRNLPEAERSNLDEAKAIALMARYPTLIKRPVLEHRGDILVGFKPDIYAERFK